MEKKLCVCENCSAWGYLCHGRNGYIGAGKLSYEDKRGSYSSFQGNYKHMLKEQKINSDRH